MADADLLARVRAVAGGAAAALGAARQRIDDLNVYPVPDGDTGTNLSQTVARVLSALDEAEPAPAERLAFLVRDAALRGAKGNSGVILSQILRGFCDTLGGAPALDAAALARALRGASDVAYRGVRQPVEGTILTVIREMAEAAEAAAAEPLEVAIDAVLQRAEDALARTPDLLERLREAGVVDAGGAGLVELARGAGAAFRGEEVAPGDAVEAVHIVDDVHAEPSAFRYCTNYIVAGDGVDGAALEAALAALGDCLIVVGDTAATRVHVHTDDPGAALSLATAMGGISAVEVADMHRQIANRSERLEERPALQVLDGGVDHRRTDVVFVTVGAGNAAIARGAGARGIVSGGQSMNPSTEEILRAVEAADADEVVVLPNNRNVVLAAAEAVRAAAKPAALVETASIPQGLAALLAYEPGASAEANAESMTAAAAGVRFGEVTRAVRAATVDGVAVRDGDYLGLVDGRIVVAHASLEHAVADVAARLVEDGREFVTALTGAGTVDAERARQALEAFFDGRDGVELEVHDGGQPHYPLLLSAE
jgi:hypothetical protein